MCYKEKNKYTYLSMCSCCNAVSKYSSIVKKHLLKQHKTLPESAVIPIRIENKFERKIKKTLDRATDQDNSLIKRGPSIVAFKKNHVSSKVKAGIAESKRSVNQREISIHAKKAVKCAVCDDVFNDCMRYIFHLVSSHSNINFRVSFKCVYCNHTVQYLKDMQDHFEKKHKGKCSLISLVNCINVEISSENSWLSTQKHCPYCELKFEEAHNVYDHIVKTHEDSIESVLISEEITDKDENLSQKGSDLIVFQCHSCPKSFHTLQDIWEHIKERHVQNKTYSKPKRKRKPPKWMENDFEEIDIKRPKNVNISKKSSNMVLSTEKFEKGVTEGFERKCKLCSYVAKTDKAFVRHISSYHSKQNFKLPVTRKNMERAEYSGTDVKLLYFKDSKNSQPLIVDITSERVVDNVNSENFDAKGGTNCGTGEVEPHFNDIEKVILGDSDDDFVPNNSGSDSEEMEEKNNAPFNCVNCKKSFTSRQSLHKHTKLKHPALADIGTEEKLLKTKLRSRDVKMLVKEDKGTSDCEKFIAQYKCPFCELKLHHYEYMRSHVVQSHPEITNFRLNTKKMVEAKLINEDDCESFKCPNPKCDVVYKRKQTLKEHMVTCAKGKFRKEEILCTLPRAWMEKLEKSVNLICQCCHLVMKGKVLYEEHLLQHDPYKVFEIELINTLSSEQIQKDNCKSSELECTMCPYCDFVATKKINISKHKKRFHSNEKGTDVVSCILVNKSSVKVQAKLVVKDIKNDSSARDELPRIVAGEEENTKNITLKHTMDIEENAEVACLNELINNPNDTESDQVQDNTKHQLKGKEIEGNEIFETVSIQSTIPSGTYICPLCDFKTGIKKEIKTHMNEHNSTSNEDTDSIYTISDSWIKVDNDKNQPFKCQICDHEDVNLTFAFRHVLNTHKDIMVKEPSSDPHVSEALFEIVNVEIEGAKERYEREKYRCTTCVPGHIFKSKRGLQLHLKTRHTDTDSTVVYETMYKMLDLISDPCNTRQIYICCLCQKELWDISDLRDHFNQTHPEKLGELKYKLRRSPDNRDGTLTVSPTCEVCCKQFMDTKSLKHHLILHMNKYKPTCSLCNISFINHAELESHNMEAHSKAGEMCDICGAMFLITAKLNRHVKWHENGESSNMKVLCQYCGTTVIGKNMKKHLVDKHINLISCDCDICTTQDFLHCKKSVQCDQCDAFFCTWYVLKAHKYREHSQVKGGPFKCKYCNSLFQSKREQSLHSHKCGKDFSLIPTKVDSDITTADIANYTEVTLSEETNIDFSLGLAYVKQEYIVVDKKSERPYSCKLCRKSFTRMRYICNHLRRLHTKDETKRFRCKICKMGFVGKKEFSSHCRIHIGLRQFQCKICHKMYKTAAHLKEHSEIHSLQTYSCEYCGLEFKQRGALLSHVVHHDKVKPFKCLYCSKGYTTHGDLQRHMNSYSKDTEISGAKQLTFCNYCSKDLPNHTALVKHFQIHLPINPFQCLVCQNNFASFREMYNHKSRKKHFTDLEKEGGRQDLQAPGNRFRKYKVSKSKAELVKTNKGTTYMEDSDNALAVIADDENIVEIEIDGSVAECDDRTKAVIDMFESNVIKSMLDADPETMNTVEFHDTDIGTRKDNQSHGYSDKSSMQEGCQFEIQEESNYPTDVLTMQNMYLAVRHNTDNNLTSQNNTTFENSEKFASIVAEGIQQQETIAGKTQTFQASDGSIIHVCVIKPDK